MHDLRTGLDAGAGVMATLASGGDQTDEHDARLAPWRLEEWQALPEVCLIAACEGREIDQRGPVFLRDGTMHKACVEHWEPIYRVLGEQASWEREDASRERPSEGAPS